MDSICTDDDVELFARSVGKLDSSARAQIFHPFDLCIQMQAPGGEGLFECIQKVGAVNGQLRSAIAFFCG